MNNKFTIILVFFWLISSLIYGQQNEYPFTRIDIKNGISHNQVTAILKDSKGFMWFGTIAGLNRYDGYKFKTFRHNLRDSTSLGDDGVIRILEGPGGKLWIESRYGFNIFNPETETFNRNPTTALQKFSIPGLPLVDILIDLRKNYWFIHSTQGLFKYSSSDKKTTQLKHKANDLSSISSDLIDAGATDSKNNLWIINNIGTIEKIDGQKNKVVYRNYALPKANNADRIFYRIFIDAQDELWIYSSGENRGVFYFNPVTKLLKHFYKESKQSKLNTNIIKGILQDNKGLIWIGTDHGGINIINKKTFAVNYLTNNADDDKSLSQNVITSMYKDNSGIIWIGTYKKGINYYSENILKFPLYKHRPSNPGSLNYDDVNCFAEDSKGNIWIGTNGGGLIYFNRITGKFNQYLHSSANSNSLSNDVIVSLCMDDHQKLWIGTYFGGLDCYDGKTFIHFQHSSSSSNSIADNRVWKIFQDSRKKLWIGTLGGGLDCYDRDKKIFTHYTPTQTNSVTSNFILDVTEDKEGNIWIGTSDGIDVLEKRTGRFVNYTNEANNMNSLSNNNIMGLLVGSNGRIWVATRDGLNLFDKKTKTFKSYRIENGLPDNAIMGIVEDNNHNLWVSTPNGISNIIIDKHTSSNLLSLRFMNYDESDGLQGREFNEHSAYKTKRGEIIFGGANGFNLFFPQKVIAKKDLLKLVFTDFQLFNRSVNVGEKIESRIILSKPINESKEITLKNNQNIFSLEFAALDFANNAKNKYEYMLEGFNKEWLTVDSKLRRATFTNLDPGDYIFHVKVANEDGSWSKNELQLKIKILPPFWETPIAYLIYLTLIAAALYYTRKSVLQKVHARYELEQERQEAHHMHELDLMKIKFFTNVSHEFRTPLSLIITPLDQLITNTQNKDQLNQFKLIQRNARRLLNMVNQLLDFRKLEFQELKLNPSNGDIIIFLKEISYNFSDIAEKKDIHFSFESAVGAFNTSFDIDKIERILFNLLSNAFKFTSAHGKVDVMIDLKEDTSSSLNNKKYLVIKVKNTGIGIPADKHERIFERFFQNDIPGSIINQGSGIGLSITKEFVHLHGGTISVESEPGKGSCFIVILPVIELFDSETDGNGEEELGSVNETTMTEDNEIVDEIIPVEHKPETKSSSVLSTLLLIEDNEDFRFYLKNNLKAFYNIIDANNGKEGWHKVLQFHPDLVVSDINMPVMNGIELCKKIKNDPRTSHIPVILLTAYAAQEQQLAGYQTGASDYITKPFNFEILQSRIKNLLIQQESLRLTYKKQVNVNPTEVPITSEDEKLIQHALEVVEKNMNNAEFSVEELSRELHLSRVSLYKKLFSITGKPPIEFIRYIRIKRSAQLLGKSQKTISEIAYEVGFNSPKYFSKYFKAEFGMLPSEYINEMKKTLNG